MRLLVRILFDVKYCVERQIWRFLNFLGDSSLLKQCCWTEKNCGEGEVGTYNQAMLFNS